MPVDRKEIERNVVTQIRDKIVPEMRDNHSNYYVAYLEERGLNKGGKMFDPTDLVLYVAHRLQQDNDWLVDQLAKA